MKVYVKSTLRCDPDRAWAEVQRSSLLVEVARPLLVIRPVKGERLPERWRRGSTVRCTSYLFGIIPLGMRDVFFERVDHRVREIQTREKDSLIRCWDHLIRIQESDDGGTCYSDEIEIEAGWLTVLVWLFAQLFYRHRQRRWKAVGGDLGRNRCLVRHPVLILG